MTTLQSPARLPRRTLRTTIASLSAITTLLLFGCGKRGLESAACTQYFEKNETCASRSNEIKAQTLRATASTSKENFKKNLNPIAVQESCKMMLEVLEQDPDCK